MTVIQPDSLALEALTAAGVREGDFDKAILPIGATEYHGDHLPYGTDTVAAETLARRFALNLGNTLLLPTLPYGMSTHHLSFPWTLSLRPETLSGIVVDIGESLWRQDFRKLLIVAAHDGNPAPVEVACRTLYDRHRMHVALFTGWQGKARALLAPRGLTIDLDHGGQSETSMVLYGAPGLAVPARSADPPRKAGAPPVQVFGAYGQLAPDGYSGHASRGTVEEGRRCVDAIADDVVPFLRDLDAHGWQPGPWIGL